MEHELLVFDRRERYFALKDEESGESLKKVSICKYNSTMRVGSLMLSRKDAWKKEAKPQFFSSNISKAVLARWILFLSGNFGAGVLAEKENLRIENH